MTSKFQWISIDQQRRRLEELRALIPALDQQCSDQSHADRQASNDAEAAAEDQIAALCAALARLDPEYGALHDEIERLENDPDTSEEELLNAQDIMGDIADQRLSEMQAQRDQFDPAVQAVLVKIEAQYDILDAVFEDEDGTFYAKSTALYEQLAEAENEFDALYTELSKPRAEPVTDRRRRRMARQAEIERAQT